MANESPTIVPVRRHEDFARVYNLPDPRSYYRALQPLDYRMPTVMSDFLSRHGPRIAAARGKDRLRLLDFACGYAPNGALLNHALTLERLYAFYASDAEGEVIVHDQAFFAARRHSAPPFEIGGLDVADLALDYALRCGLLSDAFAEDLTTSEPSAALHAFLRGTDIVLETGGLGDLLAPSFERLLDCVEGNSPPWFLYSPRGNVDERPLQALFRTRGYRLETCSREPFRYRRLMDPEEEAAVTAAVRHQGRNPTEHVQDGYFVNPLRLARPERNAEDLPVSTLML